MGSRTCLRFTTAHLSSGEGDGDDHADDGSVLVSILWERYRKRARGGTLIRQ